MRPLSCQQELMVHRLYSLIVIQLLVRPGLVSQGFLLVVSLYYSYPLQ